MDSYCAPGVILVPGNKVAGFIGSPAMNFLKGALQKMQNHNLIARWPAQESIEIGNKFYIQLRQYEIIYVEPSTGMIL